MKPSKIVRVIFFATVVVLVVAGFGSLLRIKGGPDHALLYGFYAAIMFGDAAVFLYCVSQLNKRKKWIFTLTVIVLCLNIVPAIFDQFGLVDLLFLLLNLFTLIFLIIARKEFLPA